VTAPEIIEKLRPKLREEGLEVEFLGQDGPVVNIRAKRVAPGVPVAFLVKAIAGTYRRYMPEIEDVCLAEYDPGEAIPTAPSATFEPVFQHKPVAAGLELVGLPTVDLSGLDRRQAVQALESFYKVWSQKSPVVGVEGLTEDGPLRAAKKWASVYRDDYSETQVISDGRWNIIVSANSEKSVNEMLSKDEERMPGKIFILLAEDSD
jgi:hypothetical protein